MRDWLGGADNPAKRGAIVMAVFRDGRIKTLPAKHFDWRHDPKDRHNDIVEFEEI